MAYGKIFESMFTGSMVGKGATMFAVWAYCISNCKPVPLKRMAGVERRGYVELNPNILAAILGASVTDVEDAIDALCSPDPKSRTKDYDGRRLLTDGCQEFTYELATFSKYDDIRSEEQRREQNRLAKARSRERERGASATVSTGQQCQPTETETQSRDVVRPATPSEEPTPVRTPRQRKAGAYSEGFLAWWSLYPKKVAKGAAWKAWQKVATSGATRAAIMVATTEFARRIRQAKFVPNPATWLNESRWEDDISAAPACAAPMSKSQASAVAHNARFEDHEEYDPTSDGEDCVADL